MLYSLQNLPRSHGKHSSTLRRPSEGLYFPGGQAFISVVPSSQKNPKNKKLIFLYKFIKQSPPIN